MKKLNRNILFGLGSLAAVVAPVAAVVACGDSDSKSTEKTTKPVTTTGTTNPVVAVAQSSTPSDLVAAWDETTRTIDLAKINNQFDLVRILSDKTGFAQVKGLSTGFDAPDVEADKTNLATLWATVKTKLEAMIAKQADEAIHLTYNGHTIDFNLDIKQFGTAAIEALTNATDATPTAAGGDSMTGEMTAGAPLLQGAPTQRLIQSILQVSAGFAMGDLMKLTHIPAVAFDNIGKMLVNIQSAFITLTSDASFTQWIADKNINVLRTNESDATILAESHVDAATTGLNGELVTTDKDIIMALFVVKSLQR